MLRDRSGELLMSYRLIPAIALALVLPAYAGAQQEETYDYWQFNRDMVRRGQLSLIHI